jgi:hypothetical protein
MQPATFRLVTHSLNKLRYSVPENCEWWIETDIEMSKIWIKNLWETKETARLNLQPDVSAIKFSRVTVALCRFVPFVVEVQTAA